MEIIEINKKKFFHCGTSFYAVLPPYKLLQAFYSKNSLKNCFEDKFKTSKAKGIDRLNGYQFEQQLDVQIKNINKKCLSGTYKFTPYAEVLQSKGRGKSPRLIGIPTVRDRLVLNQLKDILSNIYPECVPKTRANTLVHKISREIQSIQKEFDFDSIKVFGCDIKGFYDEINRDILITILKKRIKSSKLIRLIESAIKNPIVPRNYRNKNLANFITSKGVPQGLSISNILAAIYLYEFDKFAQDLPIKYFRYVDDILIIHTGNEINEIQNSVEVELKKLDLHIHPIGSGKTHSGCLKDEFGYLGYLFDMPKISVRQSTVERFLQSVVGKFSDYRHNKKIHLEKFKYLTELSIKQIFLLELNEKITGAISEQKKYGWIAYFSEITDLELLAKLDNIISKFFERMDDFGKHSPGDLKKLTRTYYEMKYSPTRGYIHNYDSFDTNAKKIAFLSERGRLDPDKSYSEDEINEIFVYYRNRNLSDLEPDDATMY